MNLSVEDAKLLWDDVVEMAHDCDDASVVPWLERLSPVSLEDNVLTVSTRQNWTARKTMGEYREVIESLLHEITLENVTLSVVVVMGGAQPDAQVAGTSVSSSTTSAIPSMMERSLEQSANMQIDTLVSPYGEMEHSMEDNAGGTVESHRSAAALAGAAAAGRAFSPVTRKRTALSPIADGAARAAAAMQPTDPAPRPQEPPADLPASIPTFAETPVMDMSGASEQPLEAPAGGAAEDRPASDLRFDTYIVGEANKLAYSMARAVAEQPGTMPNLNPLFIWGPSGNGKTHLLHSIENYIAEHQPAMHVLFVNSNEFVENYIDDIRNKRLRGTEVLKAYRGVDVLLVDDVQFFEAKQESVTTFFDIFNQLKDHGKQVVLAADTPPDYLELDDRMRTRFGSGLVVDVKAPTYEMKRSILKSYYDRYRSRMDWCTAEIPSDLFDLIAQLAPNNPRTMQSLMTSILVRAASDPSTLTPEGIKETVKTQFKSAEEVSVDSILHVVTAAYDVTEADIRSKSRKKKISEARQVAMWMARTLTETSYDEIGRQLGGRDHATVYYSISVVEKRTEEDKSYLYKLERLKEEITGSHGGA